MRLSISAAYNNGSMGEFQLLRKVAGYLTSQLISGPLSYIYTLYATISRFSLRSPHNYDAAFKNCFEVASN